jgi:hypothetical protein
MNKRGRDFHLALAIRLSGASLILLPTYISGQNYGVIGGVK